MTDSGNGLTLNVLQNVVRIVDVCTQRGAFKPDELQVVGATYNALKSFVDVNVEKVRQQNAAASAAAEESNEQSNCDGTPGCCDEVPAEGCNDDGECCGSENCNKPVNDTDNVKNV